MGRIQGSSKRKLAGKDHGISFQRTLGRPANAHCPLRLGDLRRGRRKHALPRSSRKSPRIARNSALAHAAFRRDRGGTMPGDHRHASPRTHQSSRRQLGLLARTTIGRTNARQEESANKTPRGCRCRNSSPGGGCMADRYTQVVVLCEDSCTSISCGDTSFIGASNHGAFAAMSLHPAAEPARST